MIAVALGAAAQSTCRIVIFQIVGRHLNYYWRITELLVMRRLGLIPQERFEQIIDCLHSRHFDVDALNEPGKNEQLQPAA